MESLKPLSDFFSAIEKDYRISITHIGVYAALLKYSEDRGFASPIQVFSYEIMRIAKISASTVDEEINNFRAIGPVNSTS